jgi:hypothetical protein
LTFWLEIVTTLSDLLGLWLRCAMRRPPRGKVHSSENVTPLSVLLGLRRPGPPPGGPFALLFWNFFCHSVAEASMGRFFPFWAHFEPILVGFETIFNHFCLWKMVPLWAICLVYDFQEICSSTASKSTFFKKRHHSQRFARFTKIWHHSGGSFFVFVLDIFWDLFVRPPCDSF